MRWLNLTPVKQVLIVIFVVYGVRNSYGQTSCGCPVSPNCKPCDGGISTITFKNNGPEAEIQVYDNGDDIYDDDVVTGGTFTVGQSKKFKGTTIEIYSNTFASPQVIDITCGMVFDPSISYGNLTIVSAMSKKGGPLCCTSDGGSTNDPEILGCTIYIQVPATAACTAPVSWNEPTVNQCDATLKSTHSPGATFPIGTTTVIYTATNSNNKTSTCEFNVTVVDTSKPVLVTPTAPIPVDADPQCKANPTWTPPAFFDCSLPLTLTSTHNPGSTFTLGTTNVTYTARDKNGNTATTTFAVTVKDVTAPTVVSCPSQINLNVTGNCKASATWTAPVFSDGCTAVTVTPSHSSGTEFPVGATEVTYTAVDKAGNTSFCKFNVVVKDQVAPVLSSCPQDTTVSVTTLPGNVAIDWLPPVASDDCGLVTLTSSHKPGDKFSVGSTVVTYTASDISGNTSTCDFTVTVGWESTNLEIGQLVTPDGNQENDQWIIGNIEKYENNRVVIVDRWGNEIYSVAKYDNVRNVWKGENSRGNMVPTGTYFYSVLLYSGSAVIEKKGFIEVIR
ncbi:MAG: HYR domain-containing protein [Chryseolinea sp.]